MLDADVPSWGIVWREADRQGNLSVPRCQALRVSNGEMRCCCCYVIDILPQSSATCVIWLHVIPCLSFRAVCVLRLRCAL
jgi:hypothetical protein